MHSRNPALLVLALLSLTGCLGSLRASAPPVYYELSYTSEPVTCEGASWEAVRVWHFSASSPFDRDEMVVLESSHQTRFSPEYRWIAVPGVMMSDQIIRDLSGAGIFSRVISTGDPYDAPMQLSGRIFQFGWKDYGTVGRAVLDLEVSLWTEEPDRKILFRKRFQLEGREPLSGSPERLAAEMSDLVKEFSTTLQKELCATLKGSSSQAGD